MSGTPELLATRDHSTVVSRVAAMLRHRWMDGRVWDADQVERVFLGVNDGLQSEYCIYRADGHRIEPYLRAARQDAIEAGFAPASVERARTMVESSGNIFGVHEALADPVIGAAGAPALVHDAATRLLLGTGLDAARRLLLRLDGDASELAIASCGLVEADLGLTDLARRGMADLAGRLDALPAGPVVTIDATLALAIRAAEDSRGPGLGREVMHLSRYLVDHPRRPRPQRRVNLSAVYHDAGPLARGLGVVEEPRALLRDIAGMDLLEATPTGRRASSDGPLAGYPRADIAATMARTRVDELAETGADCIVVADPYSLRNLRAVAGDRPVVDLWALLDVAWEEGPDMETRLRDVIASAVTRAPGVPMTPAGPGGHA